MLCFWFLSALAAAEPVLPGSLAAPAPYSDAGARVVVKLSPGDDATTLSGTLLYGQGQLPVSAHQDGARWSVSLEHVDGIQEIALPRSMDTPQPVSWTPPGGVPVSAVIQLDPGTAFLSVEFSPTVQQGSLQAPGGPIAVKLVSLQGGPRHASLCVDTDRDGAINTHDKLACSPTGGPVQIDGRWWSVSVSDDGRSMQAVPTAEQRALHVGAAAPALEGPGLDGEAMRLADFRGQWVLLDFWAIWCQPCREQHPQLAALVQVHPEVQVLGIASDSSAGAIVRYQRRHGYDWPQIWLGQMDPQTLAYEVYMIPQYGLVDPQGRLAALGPLEVVAEALTAAD